jgi:putative effector of murein hydrolase
MLQVRLPCTVIVAMEPVAIPSTSSMSVTVAVAVSVVEGDTVNDISAGFVIVAGMLSEMSGEHFPDVPETLHDCA